MNELPSTFTVPLEIVDPTSSFLYEVFLDFDPLGSLNSLGRSRFVPVVNPIFVEPANDPPDGGIIAVHFTIDPTLVDPSVCHVIQFIVALGLSQTSLHTPDSNGADEIEWQYAPAGGERRMRDVRRGRRRVSGRRRGRSW